MSYLRTVMAELVSTLDEAGVEYMFGGSVASSAWGEPRFTNDFDVVIKLVPDQVSELIVKASPRFEVEESDVSRAIGSREVHDSFQMLHREEIFKIDCFPVGPTEFDEHCFQRRVKTQVDDELEIWMQPADDCILQKLRWYKAGNQVSDRQLRDILNMLRVQAATIDTDYIRDWAAKINVSDVLERVLEMTSDETNPQPS